MKVTRYGIGFVAFLTLPLLNHLAQAQRTVSLVRHAERPENGAGDDPHLTDDGVRRAKTLAGILEEAGVTGIVTSDANRTRETAAPTAKTLHLDPKEINLESVDEQVQRVFEALQALGDGGAGLYLGHSNTLEPLLRKYRYQGPFTLDDDPHGNFFILVPGGPSPALLRLHYPKE
jgi:2,3-bisphosphoglycerate-dependent phosphoglycerate mutase